jgi:membrane-bound metal-dependent hydrolase YbcI (DUF457 family)
MPGYKGHLLFGTIIFLPAIILTQKMVGELPLFTTIISFLAILLGSLFPDIDTTSKIQRIFYVISIPLILITLILQQTTSFFIASTIILFVYILKHRTITHQLSFIIIIPGIFTLSIYYFYSITDSIFLYFYIFFTLGAINHIILDKITSKIKMMYY